MAKHTIEQKIEILTHAKKHGVMAAAQMYDVSKRTLSDWNKELKIYTPKRRPRYTTEQKIQILEYVKAHGYKAAMRMYNVPRSSICTWNTQFNVFPKSQANYRRPTRKSTEYSTQEKLEILEHAKNYGIFVTVEKYNIGRYRLAKWNKIYHVYDAEKHTKYDEKYKINVLNYAAEHGPANATKNFGVSFALLARWNKKYNVYPARPAPQTGHAKPYVRFSVPEKIEILNFAKENGRKVASVKYNIPVTRLSAWNKKYNIIPTYRHVTPEQRAQIIEFATRFGIADAARRFGVVHAHVQYMIKKHQPQEQI